MINLKNVLNYERSSLSNCGTNKTVVREGRGGGTVHVPFVPGRDDRLHSHAIKLDCLASHGQTNTE